MIAMSDGSYHDRMVHQLLEYLLELAERPVLRRQLGLHQLLLRGLVREQNLVGPLRPGQRQLVALDGLVLRTGRRPSARPRRRGEQVAPLAEPLLQERVEA